MLVSAGKTQRSLGLRHEELAVCVVAIVGTPALAADMALKAPPPPPAPVYSWTGWYVGGNVGYSWGDAPTTGNASLVTFPGLLTLNPGFPGFPASFAFADHTTHLNGAIGGGQVGYNYQFSPNWVLGFETDIQASGQRGSGSFADPFSTPIVTGFLVSGGVPPVPVVPGVLQGTADGWDFS